MLGTLRDLAQRAGGRAVGDESLLIERIAAVEESGPGTLTFATDERYLAAALRSRAAAVLVDASIAPADTRKALIVVENARLALARLLATLRPPRPKGPFRHATAVVEPDAEVAPDAYLGAHAYVGHGSRVGAGCVVAAGAYVGDDVAIGESSWLHSNASVMNGCRLGSRVVLHAGCVVGSEGFGWAFVDGRLERIPQIGNVVIEDDVEVGANSCIDRAQTGSTYVGTGTKIDNLVQIGHNSRIGKHCALAALTGLAGSTVVGDYVKIAGQVGTRGHMTIGSRSTVAGQSGVWGDVPEGTIVSGNPAREHREELRREVMIRRLPKLVGRVEAIERALGRDSLKE